ncbi:DUF3696 domain-containing protein [Nonomuraea ferruginea]
MGRRGELAVEALIASQADKKRPTHVGSCIEKDGPRRTKLITVEEHVASWLQELGLIHSFAVESVDDRGTLYRVQVRRSAESTPVLLTDVGFGVSQVLPVLVLLAYAPERSTVLLEQPEIHLHPAVQSGLADVIIEVAKVRNIQVVVESHSEHFLMRLQRRIAERDVGRGIRLEPEDCLLYFCQTTGAAATISRLGIDSFGNITNWPDDFFGNQFEEAAAMSRAARRRATEEKNRLNYPPRVVIDTNVLIVANGKADHVFPTVRIRQLNFSSTPRATELSCSTTPGTSSKSTRITAHSKGNLELATTSSFTCIA